MTNEALISEATKAINSHTTKDGRIHGDVGAAVLSKSGQIFRGTCIDTTSWGLCAERSALAAMITNGREYAFEKIVAVWRDEKTGKLHVLPPCGACREFMRQIHEDNLESDVVLGITDTQKLKTLIPYHEWPQPLS